MLVMSADKSGAICKSSAVKIGAQRSASLVMMGEGCQSCSNEGGRRRVGGKADETRARGYYSRHVELNTERTREGHHVVGSAHEQSRAIWGWLNLKLRD